MRRINRNMLAYVLAVVLTVATFLVRWGMGFYVDRPMLLLFVVPILFSAFLGGLGPGLLATVFSGLGAAWLFHVHDLSRFGVIDLVQWAILMVVGVLISLVSEAHRRAARLASEALREKNALLARQAEAVRHERDERLRFHMENSPLALIEWDRDFHVTRWSRGAERIFGWGEREVLGKHPLEFGLVDEADREAVERIMAELTISRGEGISSANRNRCRDGSLIECEWHNSALLDGQGELISILSLGQDVTERKQAEAELRRTTALLQALSEATPDPVFAKDSEGRMLLANPATLRAIGKPAEAVLGKSETEWLDDAAQAATIMANDRRIMESGRSEVVEEAMNTPGGVRVFLGTKTPLHDEAGRVIGIVGISRDITMAKQAEEALCLANQALSQANERLAEADRRKDEFLAMLAHELRNPLAPVRNAVKIMQLACCGACDGAERMQRQRAIIDRQVSHMARLLDDLLDVSRVTRGKIILKKKPVVLAELLPHAMDTVQPQLEARGLALHYTAPPEGLRVEADSDRLLQIVGNLLTNAAKYTDNGGQIWLTTEVEGTDAVMRVRDSGMGIAPEMLGRIFDLFAQIEGGLDRAQGGLGIGLTMVRSLVQLHGGTIEARSAGLGQGSEFIVRLPALAEAAAVAAGVDGAGLRV